MLELNEFKEGLCRGRLLWVKGSEGLQKIGVTRELLRCCEIPEQQVFVFSVKQFLELDLVKTGMARDRVLILRDLEVETTEWNRFLIRLKECESLRFIEGIRVILVSSDSLPLSRKIELYQLNPWVIRITGEGGSRVELNERIHGLIQKASYATQKPVFRVSERFAAFLEDTGDEWTDAELLDWFVWGISRSHEGVLRFADLFPQNCLKDLELGASVTT